MIYFTADHHFSHTNIIKYCGRPFQSTEEMNRVMIQHWNETVHSEDVVYYLGDFSLGMQSVREILPNLNGEKYLIMGNHDQCHPSNKKRAEKARDHYLQAGFKSLQLEMILEISEQSVLLTHFPYASDALIEGYDLKFQQYRPKDDGRWLLHGHVHEKWQIKGRMINVGVDVWDFRPVPIAKIADILKGGVK